MKRLICLLLTLSFCIGGLFAFASCGDTTGNTEDTDTKDNSNENNGTAAQGSEEELYRPEDIDFDGFEYRILVRSNQTSGQMAHYVYEGTDTPSAVVDYAVWCRQNLMESKHGVTMRMVNEGEEAPNKLRTAIMSNIADYCHGASLGHQEWTTLAAEGCLIDLNSLDELNLSASYWDQRIQEEFDINGHLFALEGEFNIQDDFQTYVVIYNDTVYEDLGYDDQYGTPYDLAADGKWTYEMMMQMIKDVSHQVEHDDVMDEDDYWGFVSETPVPYYFFLGSGNKYVRNINGELNLAAADPTVSETNYNILSDLITMGSNKDIFIANRDCTNNADVWTTASDIFATNRALFRSTALSAVMRLLDMTDDYGIMPIPNYTENQGEYYCWCTGTTYSIPVNVTDHHQAAKIFEMISYYSLYSGGDSLHYAFYDLLAYARLCRDADDVDMLELVFANKTYDIDFSANLMGVRNIVARAVGAKEYTTLFSDITAAKGNATTAIQNFVVSVEGNLIDKG